MPQAAEVEGARLLANDARQTLRTADFSDEDIDRLADDFIAEDRGEETGRSSPGHTTSGEPPKRPAVRRPQLSLRLDLGAGPRGCATGGW
jgi:hypothetical protein